MTKWHINKHGVPALCKAKDGRCPLGGNEQHFDNVETAQEYANREMETQFGLLPNSEEERKKSIENNKNLSNVVSRIAQDDSAGFVYETYAALSVADKIGLERTTVYENNKPLISMTREEGEGNVALNYDVDEVSNILADYYKGVGANVSDKTKLVKVIHHSAHSDHVLVQSGGSNVLDAAIIKAGKVVDIIEMKELSKQAQLPSETLKVNKEGYIKEESLNGKSEDIKKAMSTAKIQDADGTDFQLDFGSGVKNERVPLEYLVDTYKQKGATSFIYTTNNREDVHTMDITGDTDEVVDEMIKNKIEANVRLRANNSSRKVNDDDIYRFNKVLSKDYFKSGRSSDSESFTLKSIKEDKITKSGEFVRVGGYITPIKYETYKENMNKRIKKTDLKAFNLILTGNIKVNY